MILLYTLNEKNIVLTNNKTKKKRQVIFFYTAVYFTLIAVESLLNDEKGEEEQPSPGMLIPALRTQMQSGSFRQAHAITQQDLVQKKKKAED